VRGEERRGEERRERAERRVEEVEMWENSSGFSWWLLASFEYRT